MVSAPNYRMNLPGRSVGGGARLPRRRGGEPHRAMFGRRTFIVRVAEDAMAPRVHVGDYVWIDPDEPAADGHLVAVRDPGRDGRCPGRTVDAGNETDIRGVVVLVGNRSERRRCGPARLAHRPPLRACPGAASVPAEHGVRPTAVESGRRGGRRTPASPTWR